MCWPRFYSDNSSTRAKDKKKKKKVEGHLLLNIITAQPLYCSVSRQPNARVPRFELGHGYSVSSGNRHCSPPRRQSVRADICPPGSSQLILNNYHKLEGLSPGWVKEGRCKCGASSSSRPRDLPPSTSPTLPEMNAYVSGNHAQGCYRGEKTLA